MEYSRLTKTLYAEINYDNVISVSVRFHHCKLCVEIDNSEK
jgi:hypothetical protein